ncbi:hypothetical protein CW357_10970 [Rummeliibacillus sp. TYF005]|uniref:hypothetical protein n=1 Tax=Rummeliibacillus sp. TYF005 TaxID=2058214 RepID=UPI000F53CE9E|nr:hypothetical protein [Rummeliibacillus sp. TYF005]RPJ95267.1 hypothetical protein CW357_10970 [Rummeliibacillus sp. TYF005]
MKNKKLLVSLILVSVIVVGFVIYTNTPKMKAINNNPNWDYKVLKDKNVSEELEGVLSQKDEKDKMEIDSFYIKNAKTEKKIITYTNEDVKAGFSEENYKNEKDPIYVEFPLGDSLKKGNEYSLILTYKINDEIKTDEIKFK